MGFLDSIFTFVGKYAETAGNVAQGVNAIQSYMAERQAANETKKANAAMMKAAETEAALTKADAAQKADAYRRDAMRARSTQISAFLKSGVTLDGSPMLVANETQEQGNRNAENIITNADYSAKAMMLRAEGNKRSVKKADIWGTAFDVIGSARKAYTSYSNANPTPSTTKLKNGDTITWNK